MRVRSLSLLITLLIVFVYLVVLTRGHLTSIPH